MRWLIGEARLWDGLCEMHAHERHAHGMASVGNTPMRDAYEMAYVRGMPMRCTPTIVLIQMLVLGMRNFRQNE
jgi:hypothetical protein